MSTAVLLMSLEEFLARPDREDGQWEELIEGELIVSPNVKATHSEIVRRLSRRLAALEEQGFVVLTDFACILPQHSMPNPDLGVVRRERWDAALTKETYLQGPPDLVIEVASPGNRKLERKAVLYQEHCAEQSWTVYPKTRTVTILTAEGSREARVGETLEFHGVTVPVAEIFL